MNCEGKATPNPVFLAVPPGGELLLAVDNGR